MTPLVSQKGGNLQVEIPRIRSEPTGPSAKMSQPLHPSVGSVDQISPNGGMLTQGTSAGCAFPVKLIGTKAARHIEGCSRAGSRSGHVQACNAPSARARDKQIGLKLLVELLVIDHAEKTERELMAAARLCSLESSCEGSGRKPSLRIISGTQWSAFPDAFKRFFGNLCALPMETQKETTCSEVRAPPCSCCRI
jgi:hypothetical protein